MSQLLPSPTSTVPVPTPSYDRSAVSGWTTGAGVTRGALEAPLDASSRLLLAFATASGLSALLVSMIVARKARSENLRPIRKGST